MVTLFVYMVPDTVKNDIQKIADALLNSQSGDTPLTVTGGGGGVEYTEGAIDATPTGSVPMWRKSVDDSIVSTSDENPLPVSASIDTTGLATSAKQDTIIGHVDGVETALTAANASLDAIEASTAAMDTDLTTIIGHVDGIETALTAANASLDAIEASSSAMDTDLTTIIGHVDGLEGLLTTIDADTGNMDTSLNNIETAVQVMDDWDNAASDGASVSGDVAHDTADAGEPVKIGHKAYSPDGTTPGTAVAEGDRTDGKADLDGRTFINARHPRHVSFHSDGSSALTDQEVFADPGDGFQVVITEITFSTGAATACNIFFEEGASKILGPWYLEAVAGRGLMWRGEKFVTASTAVTVTTSAAIAQSLDVQGYIQAV